MAKANDLINRMNMNFDKMSKGQRLLYRFVMENYMQAAGLSADRLGKLAGVSEATVVRFAVFLGYSGYPEFRDALEELTRNRLNPVQLMERAYSGMSRQEILTGMMRTDAERILRTTEKLDMDSFDRAIDMIRRSKRIYIIGLGSSSPAAELFGYYLNLIRDGVTVIGSSSAGNIYERIIRIGSGDLMINISLPPYAEPGIRAMEIARERGAERLVLTDSEKSPAFSHANCALFVQSDTMGIIESFASLISLMNAIIIVLCMQNPAEVSDTLLRLERMNG